MHKLTEGFQGGAGIFTFQFSSWMGLGDVLLQIYAYILESRFLANKHVHLHVYMYMHPRSP